MGMINELMVLPPPLYFGLVLDLLVLSIQGFPRASAAITVAAALLALVALPFLFSRHSCHVPKTSHGLEHHRRLIAFRINIADRLRFCEAREARERERERERERGHDIIQIWEIWKIPIFLILCSQTNHQPK